MIVMHIQNTFLFAFFKGSGIGAVQDFLETGFQMEEKIQIHEPTWYFIYLFILLGIYAWMNYYYGNILVQTIQASTDYKFASRMFKSTNLLQNQLDLALYLFYFLSLTFMLYYMELRIGVFPYQLQGGLLLLFNLGLLAALFFGRVVLHNIAGFLFNRMRIVREYLYNMFVFNKLSGLLVLPLMFLMVYTKGTIQDIVFWTSIFVLAGIVILRLIRGVIFSYRKDVLKFYMFLYLCALEIMPLVLLYRWLEGIL